MSEWFVGSCQFDGNIDAVVAAVESPGVYFTGVTGAMPGITSAELVEEGSDFVSIRTNEGMMYRTAIVGRVEEGRATIEFDERYKAGSKVEGRSHIMHDFSVTPDGITLRIVIRDVTAPGFLGLMYRMFGSASIGKAFLSANTTYFTRTNA